MNQILTHKQAVAVGAAISAVTIAGGNVTRISFLNVFGGRVKARTLRTGGILVLRINERGSVIEKRSYSNLADFAAQHQDEDV